MKTFPVVAITLTATLALCFNEAFAAHILEPLGTEIASTTPRGRMFGQIVYRYEESDKGATMKAHTLPIEFELGVGEKTQLNIEGEILIREESEDSSKQERGIEEIAIGIKHRVFDETRSAPDTAFEIEFAPSIGLEGNGTSIKVALILSKIVNPDMLIHLNLGAELETERELDITEQEDSIVNTTTWLYSVAPVFTVIPDALLLVAEINGKTPTSGSTELILAPEVIGVIQTATFLQVDNMAFKLAVPIGLTKHSPDIGITLGISTLF